MRRDFLLTVLFWISAATVWAVAPNKRVSFMYNGGYFHQEDINNWTETQNGRIAFRFKEVGRNDDFIELYDSSRFLRVNIYDDAFFLKGENDGQWTKVKTGRWDDRYYLYGPLPTPDTWLIMGAENNWKMVQGHGASAITYSFKETRRDVGIIFLRSDAMAMTLLVSDQGTVLRRVDGSTDSIEILQGKWLGRE